MKLYEINAGARAYSCKIEVLDSFADALCEMRDADDDHYKGLRARTAPVGEPWIFNLEDMILDPVHKSKWLQGKYSHGTLGEDFLVRGYYGFCRKGLKTDQMYALLVQHPDVNLLA